MLRRGVPTKDENGVVVGLILRFSSEIGTREASAPRLIPVEAGIQNLLKNLDTG
jgi:hypothetical protein